ncbi:hypothetical protein ACSDR0_50970, partial [Streptosporangium sp. G11]|uniref:hypothetical protein n=1 Tax=Streptosporangium sp. G11 TaxID=3436926 RepID=UPI003EBBD29D
MIRDLRLDDIDLGNHRLTIGGHPRPLDELTRQALLAWLDYRRSRWPNTANPHLLLTQHTAMETSPVGRLWVTNAVRGLTATLEHLRIDRQLEEALTRGPDPLHLASVFGIDDKTPSTTPTPPVTSCRPLRKRPNHRDTIGVVISADELASRRLLQVTVSWHIH